MALALGTNVGFVTTAPTADPAGTGATSDGSSFVVKDTAPTGAIKITEVGWYKAAGTTSSNTQVGLYAADGATVPGEAGTRLQVTADQASGTSANVWIRFTGLNWPVTAGTAYWLGMQQDAHTGSSQIDSAASGGSGIDTRTSQTALTNPYGGGALSDVDGMYAIYAVYQSAPTVTLSSPADTATGVSTTPDLVFTGTDAESDDVRYEVQVATSAFADIVEDIHGADSDSSVSSITTPVTVASGTNRRLVVTVASNDAGSPVPPASVTYNGVALTMSVSKINGAGGSDNYTSIWELPAPDTGTHDLVVTSTGTFDFVDVGYFVLQNASQSVSPHATGTSNATDTQSPVVSATATVSGVWGFSVGYPSDNPATGTIGGATEFLGASGFFTDSGYSGPHNKGTVSHTYNGTASTEDWGISMVLVAPAPTPIIDAVSGTDAGFSGTPDNTDPFTSGQAVTYTVQSALSNSTLYYWRVRGIDPSGSNIYGAWATTRSFTTAAAGGGGATPATGFMTVNTGFWGA